MLLGVSSRVCYCYYCFLFYGLCLLREWQHRGQRHEILFPESCQMIPRQDYGRTKRSHDCEQLISAGCNAFKTPISPSIENSTCVSQTVSISPPPSASTATKPASLVISPVSHLLTTLRKPLSLRLSSSSGLPTHHRLRVLHE